MCARRQRHGTTEWPKLPALAPIQRSEEARVAAAGPLTQTGHGERRPRASAIYDVKERSGRRAAGRVRPLVESGGRSEAQL